MSLNIKQFLDEYNNLISKEGIKFVFPDFKNEYPTRFSFKTRIRKISNKNECDALLNETVNQFNDWLKIEINKIDYLSKRITDIESTLFKIDAFIAISAPEVDETCKLSFVARYIGAALLHHREVAKIYRKDKKQYLMDEQKKRISNIHY